MKFSRRRLLQLAASAAAVPAISNVAWGQAWPVRPVRFLVPLAAGGGLDFVARLTADAVSRSIGQQVIVENKVGAGGLVGIEAAAKSAPDGYTYLVTSDAIASTPHIVPFNVDYVQTLVPVSHLARSPQTISVHPSLGVSTLGELVDLAKRQPGIGYATSGAGTNQNFLGEWFAQAAGIKLEHIPYRGAGQAINDLIAGHVQMAVLGPAAVIPHHRAGTIRIIAQSSRVRSPSMPDVPTIEEAGVKGVILETWVAAFTPEKTPPAVIAQISAEMHKAMIDPAVGEKMAPTAYEPVGGSAEEMAALFREDSAKYARLAKELNIKL